MGNKITATISAFTATINAVRNDDYEQTTTECKVASKASAEREAIKYCEDKNLIFCEVTKLTPCDSVKIEMDIDLFMAKAERMEKRPNGAYVSRNVSAFSYEVLSYSYAGHNAKTVTVVTDSDNPTIVERQAKKYCRANELKYLKVIKQTKEVKALYVLSVDKFIEYGTKVESDSESK